MFRVRLGGILWVGGNVKDKTQRVCNMVVESV